MSIRSTSHKSFVKEEKDRLESWKVIALYLKLKIGTPLSGWCRNARGVSSTSTVLARSRPSNERSCSRQRSHNLPHILHSFMQAGK